MTCDIRSRMLAALVVLSVSMAGPVSADVPEVFRQMFASASNVPHPAIVQVLAPDQEAISRGSGTLIHVDGQFGYVITNWHVVRDAEREVLVIFPDGYQSLARILKMNKDWDLALLLIWAGTEQPMPLATVGPRPGDELQIAGYGAGNFRAQRGKFSTFAAPQPDMPFEMFEVMATARQGDSGGPIINQRGELVGVLFGAGDGRTTGTQIGRVRMFVNEAFDDLRDRVDAIAGQQPADAGPLLPRVPAPLASIPAATAGQGGPPSFRSPEALPPPPVAMPSGLAATKPAPSGWPLTDQAASDAWQSGPSDESRQEPLHMAEAGTPNSPASQSVEAWQAYHEKNSLSAAQQTDPPPTDAVVEQQAEPTNSLDAVPDDMGHQGREAGEVFARVDPASDQWGATDQAVTRAARPAEVSRRDLVPHDGLFPANRGMRAGAPTTVSIGPDRNMETVPQGSRSSSLPMSGGVTWDQIRSFFAAVGVFAVLHAIAKTFAFAPATKSKR